MKNIILPDYNNSILGIPNSILAHFGATPHHATLRILDEKLAKGYKNIVLLVLDGLGLDVLKAYAPDGFLMKNCAAQISSVCPCTTTSAISTFETGLSPIEHGWLGWSMHFKEIEKCVDIFTGHQSGTDRPAADGNIAWRTIGYKNLFAQINEADPSVECCRVSPFGEYKTDTNEAVCTHIKTLCKKAGRKYINAYHFQPDGDIHESGCYSERAKAHVVLFDWQIEQLAANLADTLLIVTADHGLIDIEELTIENFPEIDECLAIPPTREPRSLSFHIKPGYSDVFPRRWKQQFDNDFQLMTATEALEKRIFGEGTPHSRAMDFIGDYVALATGNKSLWYRDENGESHDFKAMHAGLSPEEMIVPLVLIER